MHLTAFRYWINSYPTSTKDGITQRIYKHHCRLNIEIADLFLPVYLLLVNIDSAVYEALGASA